MCAGKMANAATSVLSGAGNIAGGLLGMITGGLLTTMLGTNDTPRTEDVGEAPAAPQRADVIAPQEDNSATVAAQRTAEKQKSLLARGLNSTVATSALGAQGSATTQKKSLLGA